METVLLALLLSQGDGEIRAEVLGSPLVLRTRRRMAGAVTSIRWRDREFIDAADHGRELQSASNFDAGSAFTPETFNPTEAGSRADGDGPTSTSVLHSYRAEGNVLETRTQMAFWLRPGEKSEGHPAKNTKALSEHILAKKITLGIPDFPNVIEHVAVFTVPSGERHTYAQFEAVTGYMPAEFSRFWAFEAGELKPLSDGPGEQERPVVFSTESGSHAMGIIAPGPAPAGMTGPGYGRWRFRAEKVVKWNAVFRLQDPRGIPAADYTFRNYIVVGTLEDVTATLRRLRKER